MTRLPYQYVVLRCVPRVDRGEFVNVGVVLHSQAADFLECAQHLDERRLRALSPVVDVGAVAEALDAVAAVCAGTTGAGRADLDTLGRRFGWLSAPRSTVLQPGPVHSGVTHDPARTLLELLDRFVH